MIENDQIQFIYKYFGVQLDFIVKRICFWKNTGAKSCRHIHMSDLFVQIRLESILIGRFLGSLNQHQSANIQDVEYSVSYPESFPSTN